MGLVLKEEQMIRLIAVAGFALSVGSVQAMTPAPIARPDGMITQVAFGCGAGMTRYNGVCVRRYSAGVGYSANIGVSTPAYTGGGSRVYVTPYAGVGQGYYTEPHYSIYNHYYDVTGQPWDAVRAYYAGGPWYYGSNGWSDYAARNGIGCTPGTLIKGGDFIMYVCQ
jgi:hypothetical protein